MKKDAYYFPHFCNARHDRKLKRLQKDLGLEGYGIFFMVLEILREQTDFRYPYEDLDLLSDELGTSTAKVEAVINIYGLFEIDHERNFFSPKLIFYLQPYIEKSERARNANKIRWERQKQLESNTKAIQMDIQMDSVLESKESKVKNSKVKESKVKESRSSKEEQTLLTTTATEIINPFTTYQNNIGLITAHIADRMKSLLEDGITQELMSKYIEVATERNKRTWAYIEKMAQGNLENNIKTVEQYEAYRIERQNSYKNTGGSANGGNKQNTRNQYEIDSGTMSAEELAEKYKWAGVVL